MKLLRKLFAILILIMVVGIFVIFSLAYFVDPNKLKPVIAEETLKRTGYRLTMDGNLTWSFYPLLGIKIEHMTITAPGQASPFVDLQGVKIATELWQLLRGGQEKLQGNIRIAAVKLMKLNAQDARIGLHWQNNILTLQPITASLYEGSLQGTAEGRDLSAMPQWKWDVKFDRIQLKPLLADVNGADSKIKLSGIGQIKLQAETQGKSKEQLLSNLNGTSEFSINNGIVEGIDLNYFIQTADALLNKQAQSLPENTNQTAFDNLTGSAVIKNGIAKTDNLLLTSSAFTAKAQGDIDIINQALNYRLVVTPLHTTKLNWPVPILVDGSLSNPSVRLDMLTLKTMIAKEEIEKVKTKVQEHIKQLPEKADKFLQRILGQ